MNHTQHQYTGYMIITHFKGGGTHEGKIYRSLKVAQKYKDKDQHGTTSTIKQVKVTHYKITEI